MAVTVAGWLLGTAAPASASCVTPPPVSPRVFTGTVLSTEHDGRIARVRTDDHRDVTVNGTPSEGGFTSVDRTYRAGTRYEFHPVNAIDPYQDNICTATRAVAPLAPASMGTVATSEATGSSTHSELAWVAGGLLALGAAGVLLFVVRSRRRGRRPSP